MPRPDSTFFPGSSDLPKRVQDHIAKAQAEGRLKPGNAYTVEVYHDSWCNLLRGIGPCNCVPEVALPARIPNPESN